MSAAGGVIRSLARPASPDDRRRARLVSGGVAGAGGVLLVAFAIATAAGDGVQQVVEELQADGGVTTSYSNGPTLAPYIAESGLRGGTTAGALMLAVPFIAFAVLALRTGTAARERRLAALSLAGASRRQLRALAMQEGMRAAARGALLAGPVYLLLWLLLGRALPRGWRMVPDPTWWILAAWAATLVLLTLAGAIAATLASDVVRVSPLGVTRRVHRPLTYRDAVVPVVALLLVFGPFGALIGLSGSDYLIVVSLVAAIVLSLAAGRWLVQATGRVAVRRGLVSTLAGRRLLADVRTPGRAAGVLFAAGGALGYVSGLVSSLLTSRDNYDLAFFLVGSGAAALGAGLASAVACGALVIAAAEQVLDGRRGIATLVALAASPKLVQRVIRRQLVLASVPPMLVGTALGLATSFGLETSSTPLWLLGFPVAAGIGWLGAVIAARSVRPTILACSTSDNLRAP